MEELTEAPFEGGCHEKTEVEKSFMGAKAAGTLKRTRSGNQEAEVSTEQHQQEASMKAPVTEKSTQELRGIKRFPNVDLLSKNCFRSLQKTYHWHEG